MGIRGITDAPEAPSDWRSLCASYSFGNRRGGFPYSLTSEDLIYCVVSGGVALSASMNCGGATIIFSPTSKTFSMMVSGISTTSSL